MSAHKTGGDMFSRVFPGEQYSLTFEPTEEQSSAVTELAAHYATDDADQEQLLMALGLLPYESALNPQGRDTWMRRLPRPAHVRIAEASAIACVNGHSRAEHGTTDRRGHALCLACQKDRGVNRRKAKTA